MNGRLDVEPAGKPRPAPAGQGRRPRRYRRLALAAGIAATALFLWLMLFPLPRGAASWLMNRSDSWLLSGYQTEGPAALRAVRKLVGLSVQQSLAAHSYRAHRLPPGLPDAVRIGTRLTALKPLFISQVELRHGPVDSPVGIAGLGWCDGTNGFAALVLSHEFPRAEIVGVADAKTGAAHSFGRVWSDEVSDWLYFDLWADEVVVFRSRRGSPARYLWRTRPLPPAFAAREQELIARIYDRAYAGIAHNRLQPSLGGYLLSRLVQRVRGDRPTIVAATLSPTDDRTPPAPPAASGAYLQARFDHLLGNAAAARRGYARVVAAERGKLSTYGRAARIFAGRLDAAAAGP
ncbi:MAG TPA: hypothetical protein VEA60_16075 [Allosphingosinicella sp.]|nr:hypothetical protein [Allosphingosinicella sp.]